MSEWWKPEVLITPITGWFSIKEADVKKSCWVFYNTFCFSRAMVQKLSSGLHEFWLIVMWKCIQRERWLTHLFFSTSSGCLWLWARGFYSQCLIPSLQQSWEILIMIFSLLRERHWPRGNVFTNVTASVMADAPPYPVHGYAGPRLAPPHSECSLLMYILSYQSSISLYRKI